MSNPSPAAALRQSMTNNFAERPGTPFHVLVGAGFTRSAGIPTAREVAAILARRKITGNGASSESIPWIKLIQEYFADQAPYEAALAELQGSSGPPDYGAIYQRLFSELFETPLARSDFIRQLILSARERCHGYNFEGLFLAYLCGRSSLSSRHQVHTILTTNFDDVIAASFSFLETPCRIIDRPELIELERVWTQHPRILYLHGRYLNYHVINTDRQIAATLEGARATDPNGLHGKAIRSIIHRLSDGGLIVIGYAGWEDAVMEALRSELKRGSFPGGIYWCHYQGPLNANVQALREDFDGFRVIEGVSALDATRALLAAAGLGEIEVIEKVRAVSELWRTNFERRLISIEEAQRGTKRDLGAEIGRLSVELVAPSVGEALEEADRAEADTRLNVVALQIVEASLRRADGLTNQDRSSLYAARAALRHRNAINFEQTITDYFWALRLADETPLRALIDLADCLFRGGLFMSAADILTEAECLAKKLKEPKWLARCQVIRGLIDYRGNHFDRARRLLTQASEVLLREGDAIWWMRTLFNLGSIEEFEGNYEAAEELCDKVLTQEKNPFKSPYLISAFLLLRSKLKLRKADVAGARRDLLSAQRWAHEGPHFDLLGLIAFHLADCSFRAGKIGQATLENQEAIRFLGLSGKLDDQAHAKAWLDIYRICTVPSPTLELVEEVRESFRKLEEYGDTTVSSTGWAVLSWYCHASPSSSAHLRDLSCHAAEKSREVLEKPPGSPEEAEARKGPARQRVSSFMLQYTVLAELLASLAAQQGQLDRKRLGSLYRQLRKSVRNSGFQSSQVEVVHAAAALRLIEAGVLAFADLIDLPAKVKPEAFDRRWVRELARTSKHPRLGRIL
jgi:tetratricopeptide (TPR) repeat protein